MSSALIGVAILSGVILVLSGFDSNALHVAVTGLLMVAVGVFILHRGGNL